MLYKTYPFYLEFNSPFSIAHGTRNGTDLVILELSRDGIVAHGEASLPPYLPETTETVQTFIHAFFRKHNTELFDLTESLHLLK